MFPLFQDLSEIADSLSSQLETVAALNNAAALAGGGQVQVQGGRGKAGINSSSEEQEFPFKRQGFRRLSTDKVCIEIHSSLQNINHNGSKDHDIHISLVSGLGDQLFFLFSPRLRLRDLSSDRKQFPPSLLPGQDSQWSRGCVQLYGV